MFNNYFFIKRLSSALTSKLKGMMLVECFSQNKDELLIGFAKANKDFWIRANLDANISLLSFPVSISRARKNSVDLFEPLKGVNVVSCFTFQFERSFRIQFEDPYSLIFKMHGRRANILLTEDNKVIDIFRKSLTADLDLVPSELSRNIAITKEAFIQSGCDPLALIPAFGKEVRRYWEENYTHADDEGKWNEFQKLVKQLYENSIKLIPGDSPSISLLPDVNDTKETYDPIEAANWLSDQKTGGFYFEREKKSALASLGQQIKRTENYIFKTSEKLRLLQKQRNPEELANLIMANLGLIKTGLTKVTLNDFYTNDFIEIKLNPKLSPQKNAEVLYRKSKNRHQEIDMLQKNIADKQNRIKTVKNQMIELEEIDHSKELKQFTKKYKLVKSDQKEEKIKPYHEFELDGWHILVGKNAKANDELTLKVATKNDLWLHAKDVSGSHVVIKQKPGHNFPTKIIEYAAGLAAFNSKRKTDSLCPVVYTLKKFVRKTKGSAPGTMIVEKEDVLMIEPNPGKKVN